MEAQAGTPVLDALVARSNRLGAERSVCNWGGGNTASKTVLPDHLGHPTRVLWVKGPGWDRATATAASFTGLRLAEVLPLLERERLSDTEMVAYLARCFFEPGRPRPSIETLLHAFLPAAEVDHTHADATNFLARAAEGERLARELFGDELIWIPYMRPGFSLSRQVARAVRENPRARLVILAKHGLITWGESSEECFANTMATIARAHEFVQRRMEGRPAFGGPRCTLLPPEDRRRLISTVLPTLRGLLSGTKRCILRYEDTPDVLAFAGSVDAPRLVTIGAACPDHLVHTKPWPLLVDWTPDDAGPDALRDALRRGGDAYSERSGQSLAANGAQNLDPEAQ